MLFKNVYLLALLVGVAVADVAVFTPCDELPATVKDSCKVTKLQVTPCKNPTLCALKKGTRSTVNFEFVPDFTATRLRTGLFWNGPYGDVPFTDLQNADGCQYTDCPVTKSVSQAFKYAITVSSELTSGQYELKWKLWNEDSENQMCCFKFAVQLVK